MQGYLCRYLFCISPEDISENLGDSHYACKYLFCISPEDISENLGDSHYSKNLKKNLKKTLLDVKDKLWQLLIMIIPLKSSTCL